MPKPKTRVAQKRNHDRFSLRSPLKVVANDQGELVYEEAGSPSAEEQDLALELLTILRNAITRASIALSPGEGLEIVRLEMDAWSQEGREELRTEFVSCLERLAETKRQSGEAETTSYTHVKSLEMRFRPGAGFAPAGDADGPNSREDLTTSCVSHEHSTMRANEENREEHKAGRAKCEEGTLPPIPVEERSRALAEAAAAIRTVRRLMDAAPYLVEELLPDIGDLLNQVEDSHHIMRRSEVAKVLSVSLGRVNQLAKAGQLPSTEILGIAVYPRTPVENTAKIERLAGRRRKK